MEVLVNSLIHKEVSLEKLPQRHKFLNAMFSVGVTKLHYCSVVEMGLLAVSRQKGLSACEGVSWRGEERRPASAVPTAEEIKARAPAVPDAWPAGQGWVTLPPLHARG